MNEFKIRAYGRMELAQLYSPELTDIAAYRKMTKWISLQGNRTNFSYNL